MTISTTIKSRSVLGNKRVVVGTYTDSSGNGNAGAGGDVATGLSTVEFFSVQKVGAGIDSSANITVDETFPTTTGTITMIYDASVNGIFFAYGR